MNHSYRSIYNEALGAWVATSELSRARGGKKSSRLTLATVLLAAGAFGAASPALAVNECGVAAPGTTRNCVPGAFPAGITYNVDDLALNVDSASSVGTLATPVAGVGVSNVGAGAGTSSVTTMGAAVSVFTSGNYGYGMYAGATGAGNAFAASSAGTFIQTSGLNGARGILAYAAGAGNASATNNGTIVTTGASPVDGNFGVYAQGTGGNATATNNGAVTTSGSFGYGAYAVTTGNGVATASSSGTITTSGSYSTGLGAHVDNFDLTKRGTAIATLQGGGVITTNGSPYGIGIFADVNGYGDAVATNAGTVTTKGQFAGGSVARVLYGAGNATAVNQGAISTTGGDAVGLQAVTDQGAIGNAAVLNTGTVTTTGGGATGIIAGVITPGSTATATATQSSGTINTAGAGATGVLAINQGLGAATVAVNGGSITTVGNNAFGTNAYVNNPTSSGAATVTMGAGAVTTNGANAHALYSLNSGLGAATATVTNAAVTTTSGGSDGVVAWISGGTGTGAATSTVSGGTITTGGTGAHGVLSNNQGLGVANSTVNSTVTTAGANAYGVLTQNGNAAATAAATSTLTGGTVTTSGNAAHGLVALVAGSGLATVHVVGGGVTTSGASASGGWAVAGGSGTASVILDNGAVTTKNATSHGLHAQLSGATSTGSATAVMNGGTIATIGTGSRGLYAENGGLGVATSSMTGGGVTTTANDGIGVSAQISNLTTSTATATATMTGGTIATQGTRAYGVHAQTQALGSASVNMQNGAITTASLDARGLYALVSNTASTGSAATTLDGGSITTSGQRAYGIQTENRGLGAATTTITGGAITSSANFNSGVFTWINNSSAAAATTAMSGGTVNAAGLGTNGIQNSTNGFGASSGTLSGGTITTSGDSAYGFYTSITNTTSAATAMMTITNGSIATTGPSSHGAEGHTDGAGVGSLQMSGGTVSASGLNSDGVRAWSNLGTYDVAVSGGTITGGTGFASAIRTVAAGGGTIDIGPAATLNGTASGIAIRDGDPGYNGVDGIGGNAVVRSAGTVTGDAILGLGNDSFTLAGGSYTGNIYGDDRVASANDGNDSFVWTGGTLNSGFYGQNGSDTALVSAAAYNGSQILDGGDDVSAADGWVDRLTLQGVTATAGGATLRNWEVINLDNTRLTLAGAPLTVGAGLDGGGNPLGLFINPSSTLAMGVPTFAITGDVHNAGLIDLRNASGTPGNVLSVNGNYAGTNGLLRVNTALGSDTSATDKLVVNGDTSGTTRVNVVNASGAGAPTVNGIQVVQVTGSSSAGNFALAAPVQAGAYEYGLHRGGLTDGDANSFYLSSLYVTPLTPTTPATPADPATPATPAPSWPAPEVLRPAVPGYVLGQVATNELGLGLLGTLHKRMGEQQTLKWDNCGCDSKAAGDQFWGRLHAERLSADGRNQFGSDQNLKYFQIGKDLSVSYSDQPGDKSRTHTGISAGYGLTNADFGDRRREGAGMGYDTGKMKGEMGTLGAYHTRYADNGSYLDLVGQLHLVRNKYTDKYGGEASQKGAGLGLSAEIGRPWQLGDSQWLIEPQAQLTYQATRYKAFNDRISSVDGFTNQSLRARLGGRLAWNDKAERADKLTRTNTFYVTANVLHEFLKPETLNIGGTLVGEPLGAKTWAEVGVGGQLAMTKTTYLYGGLQYQHALGGGGRNGVAAQVGVRAAW